MFGNFIDLYDICLLSPTGVARLGEIVPGYWSPAEISRRVKCPRLFVGR